MQQTALPKVVIKSSINPFVPNAPFLYPLHWEQMAEAFLLYFAQKK